DRRKETAAPTALPATRLHAAGDQHHEAGQIPRFTAEAVGRPRAEARPALPGESGEEQQLGWGMVELVGCHRANDREFIGNLVKRLDGIRHPGAGLPVAAELLPRAEQLWHAGGESEALPLEELIRARLTVAIDEFRFVIEQIEVRRRAGHVQIDNALG